MLSELFHGLVFVVAARIYNLLYSKYPLEHMGCSTRNTLPRCLRVSCNLFYNYVTVMMLCRVTSPLNKGGSSFYAGVCLL